MKQSSFLPAIFTLLLVSVLLPLSIALLAIVSVAFTIAIAVFLVIGVIAYQYLSYQRQARLLAQVKAPVRTTFDSDYHAWMRDMNRLVSINDNRNRYKDLSEAEFEQLVRSN